MALNLPTFYKRTGSAIVFAAIMLTGLLWNDWAFVLLVCIIQFLCLKEYFNLVKKIEPDTWWPRWLNPTIQIGSVLWIISLAIDIRREREFRTVYQNMTLEKLLTNLPALHYPLSHYVMSFLVYLGPFILILCATLSKKTGWKACLQTFGGIIYIVIPMSFLLFLREHNHLLPLIMILMIWTNDTMAYLVGSFIGKHSFSPISPNKTWEGVVGGALLTVIGAGISGYLMPAKHSFGHIRYAILFTILGIVIAIAGTLGDLLESKLKRIAGVKDTGTLMPGHGGALDRFDSLLIVIPFVYASLYCFTSIISEYQLNHLLHCY